MSNSLDLDQDRSSVGPDLGPNCLQQTTLVGEWSTERLIFFRALTLFQHGRTEMIKDNLNPEFVKKFQINYYFEESQKLKFEV